MISARGPPGSRLPQARRLASPCWCVRQAHAPASATTHASPRTSAPRRRVINDSVPSPFGATARQPPPARAAPAIPPTAVSRRVGRDPPPRSEEHTSELQSRLHLVCRLLLEKKKK